MAPESQVSKHRLERFVRFLTICGMAWGFFGCFHINSGRYGNAILCCGEAAFSVSLIAFAKSVDRRKIVNMYLAGVTLGVVFESFLTGLSYSYTPTFLSVVVLLAAYQLGPRSAWFWSAICLSCLISIHFIPQDWLPRMP